MKSGAKGPVVLAVGQPGHRPVEIDPVGDVQVEPVDKVLLAGVWVDMELTFRVALDVICGRIVKQAEALTSTLEDRGFGLPFVASQFWRRVEPSALFGAEALANYSGGWRVAVKRLNEVHYAAAKLMLGLRGVSLGEGGHVRALLGSRFLTRLGARVL